MTTVTIQPPAVADWGRHADTAAADLRTVPPTLTAAVVALEGTGGEPLAGAWALTAVLAAATAASTDVTARMTTTATSLTTTAATYTTTDTTLAREINATTRSWQ